MYAGKAYTKAKEQAQANANWFGVPYKVFFDTSGNIRIEQVTYEYRAKDTDEIVYPNTNQERG